MTHTTNYNFNLPAGTDPAAIEPLNQNFELIDRYIKANLNNMAEDYDSSETYNTDNIVAHDNGIYKCLDDNVTGTWDSTKWEATTLGGEVGQGGGGSSVVVNPSGDQDEVLDGLEVEGVNYGLDVVGEINDVAVASFSDGADVPIHKLKVSVEAVQDLHGLPNPYPNGGGKNKLPLVLADIKAANTSGTWSGNDYTINGVTFTILTDNDGNITGVKVNGTASDEAGINIVLNLENTLITGNRYILTGCPNGGSDSTYFIFQRFSGSDTGSGLEFVFGGNTDTYTRLIIKSGYNAQNIMFYPMIRLSTESDSSFAPYSNICPISGWDSGIINIIKNLTNKPYFEGLLKGTHKALKLSDLDWKSMATTQPKFRSSTTLSDAKLPASTGDEPLIICNALIPTRYTRLDDDSNTIGLIYSTSQYAGQIWINADYESNSDFLNALGDSYVIYELNTPITPTITTSEYIAILNAFGCWTRNVDFNQTIYGGSANLLTGSGSDEYAITTISGDDVSLYSDNYSNLRYATIPKVIGSVDRNVYTTNCISSHFRTGDMAQAAFNDPQNIGLLCGNTDTGRYWIGFPKAVTLEEAKAAIDGMQLKYKLADPISFSFSPIPTTNTLEGVNNVYADCGDINTLGYFKDGKLTRSVKAIVEAITGNVNTILADAIGEE